MTFRSSLVHAACVGATAIALSGVPACAQAALMSGAAGQFTDSVTGYRWLTLQPSYGLTLAEMRLLFPTGFHVASAAEAGTLVEAMPAVPASYAADAAIAGVPPSTTEHDLIWGFYGDGSNWLYRRSTDTQWSYEIAVNPKADDLGVFAVDTEVALAGTPRALPLMAVAEPASLSILGLALTGIVAARRRRTP